MQTFVVKILGNEYSVRADRDGDHVLQVAQIVDRKMREIDRQYQQGSTVRTAVLACMNLVDEYEAGSRASAEWVCRRVGSLIEKLEKVL
ncbi:MAG: cell division protein ZapA [candidate division WOR-3 bacterium]